MEVATLIPQLFFDLIGRVAPGLYLIAMTFLAVNEKTVVRESIDKYLLQEHFPTTLVTFAVLGAGYLVGMIVGAIGYAIGNWEFPRWYSEIPKPEPNSVKYKYDFLQAKYPAVGIRLSKLSAERHACRVLYWGSIIVGISAVFFGKFPNTIIMFSAWIFVLALVAIASLCFIQHLRIRFSESLEVFYEIMVLESSKE